MHANTVAQHGLTRFTSMTVLPDGIPRLIVPVSNRQRRMVVTIQGVVLITASPTPVPLPPVGFPASGAATNVFLAATRDAFVIAPGQPVYALSVSAVGFNGISAAISDMLE